MKENSNEIECNSIEEDIEIIDSIIEEYENCSVPEVDMQVNVTFREKQNNALNHILSDYKRVLKENEELLQEKINNQKIIVLAQNDMLNYQAGFEDGKNGRTSAVQSIIENQQYYIFQKQIEKYEEHIEKLQKENEELNLKYYMLYTGKIENLKAQEVKIKSQVIPIQKVKDKIEELQNGPLKINENNKYYYETDAYNKIIIQVLQELLEGRK